VSIFIGNERKKFPGGAAAALGVVSPCLIIIMIIAAFLTNFQNNIYVQRAFSGICVCVCALILSSVINLAKKSCKTVFGAVIAIAAFCVTEFTAVSPVFVVIGAGVLGVLWSLIRSGKAGKAK
ncbi:MAG: chromate transporter, partial [Oscillospiraceae bacterium]|nr:chromate transporter [Oscillospiraceae bacterium]